MTNNHPAYFSALTTALQKLDLSWEATDDVSDEQLDLYAKEFKNFVSTNALLVVGAVDLLLVWIRERDADLFNEIKQMLENDTKENTNNG